MIQGALTWEACQLRARTPSKMTRQVVAAVEPITRRRGRRDTLIRAADRVLYAAKGNGRDRVELFISPDRVRTRSARTPV
jgi:hypothetical protein